MTTFTKNMNIKLGKMSLKIYKVVEIIYIKNSLT